jgi:hypothetical protein
VRRSGGVSGPTRADESDCLIQGIDRGSQLGVDVYAICGEAV